MSGQWKSGTPWQRRAKWVYTEARVAGEKAGRDGKSDRDNPYAEANVRKAWYEGWESGREKLDRETDDALSTMW